MCGCQDENEYICYAEKENLGMTDAEDVEICGGPCKCKCHYDEEDEWLDRLESDFDIDPDMGAHG